MSTALAAPLLCLLSVLGPPVTGGEMPHPHVLFRFADDDIGESSGLVDLGSAMATVNDSGNEPVVYVVDRRGRTVGRTRYAEDVTDPEAMAPAGPRHVWVADIGDNAEDRDDVTVYRVPVGRGDRTVTAPSVRLRYPDMPHDAEALLVVRGRFYVLTKAVTGSAVYAAPRRGGTLHYVARLPGLITDAALLPDGRHALVRGYADAQVVTVPGFRPLPGFVLPAQPQGEGISVGPHGRVRVGSEGTHAAVWQVPLPDVVRRALAGRPTGARPTPVPTAADPPRSVAGPQPSTGLVLGLLAGVGVVLALVGAWAPWRRRTG